MDSSSGSNFSSQSYEAEDGTASLLKIRVKLYGTNLFEMAVGSLDSWNKKGTDDDEEAVDGKQVIGSINRKTAWLIFFGAVVVGAIFCIFSHENVSVDEAMDMALQSSQHHLR